MPPLALAEPAVRVAALAAGIVKESSESEIGSQVRKRSEMVLKACHKVFICERPQQDFE